MKRAATILFSLLYLATTSGILVGQHLCMGRVKDTALFQKVERKCMEGMDMDMGQDMEGCCDDEWALEKVEDDQQISSAKDIPTAKYHLLYESPYKELISTLFSQEEEVETQNNGPPDISPPDLTILYHNLKIPAASQS